jgi:hypothetical protein
LIFLLLAVLVSVAAILVAVTLLLREPDGDAPLYPETEPEVDPFEQLAVLITPQELAVKARVKKRSPDPYIPAPQYTGQQAKKILETAKSLQDEDKQCFDQFIKDYQDSLFEHCRANELGDYSEGGCEQVAYKFSIHTGVVEEALKQCIGEKYRVSSPQETALPESKAQNME